METESTPEPRYPTTIALVQNFDEVVWSVIVSSRSNKKAVMHAHLMPKSVIDLVFDSLDDDNQAIVALTHDELQGCYRAWKEFTKSEQEGFFAL